MIPSPLSPFTPQYDILTSCLQAFVPGARSAVPPLATLDTPIFVHECDVEICRIVLMVRRAARNFKIRSDGHTQLRCYGMPRRSFLYNPNLPRVTSVTIAIMDRQQSVDLNQLAHDLDGNILEEFVFDLSKRRTVRVYNSDPRPIYPESSDAGDEASASHSSALGNAGRRYGNYRASLDRSTGAPRTPFYPEPWLDPLHSYGVANARSPRCPYSNKWFTLFPHARKLCLPRGLGMDPSKLSALVETSPNLEHLDLAETVGRSAQMRSRWNELAICRLLSTPSSKFWNASPTSPTSTSATGRLSMQTVPTRSMAAWLSRRGLGTAASSSSFPDAHPTPNGHEGACGRSMDIRHERRRAWKQVHVDCTGLAWWQSR